MMRKKPGKQKHCSNELSFHSFKILIFFLVFKMMAKDMEYRFPTCEEYP